MSKIVKTLIAIGVILLLLAVFKFTQGYYEDRIFEEIDKARVEKIRASKLEKIADGHYQRIIADSNTIRELNIKVDSLEVEVKNPKIVEKLVVDFEVIEKPVDGFVVNDSIITINDSYPDKVSPFVTYDFNLNLITNKSLGKFKFNKIPIDIIISEEKDGLHKADIIAPDFIIVDDFTFNSLPMAEENRVDNFGWLAGAGMYNNFVEQRSGLELTGGLRYKKVYLLGSIQTNSIVSAKALIEF